jgi:Zn-dependent protease with chaperone function
MREHWQQEYVRVRLAFPVPWAGVFSSTLAVVPAKLARIYGGAVTWLRWIAVGEDLVADAPEHVVRYVVAHEWGHVRCGHPLASMVILACAIVTTVCPRTPQWALLGWSIGMLGLAAIVWATRLEREFEADDKAAESVGLDGVREGLLWMVTHRAGGLNPDRRARLVRTGWIAPQGATTTAGGQPT